MRVPRFLKFLIGFLVCISLFRAVNGAGAISMSDVLVDLQSFEFNLDEFGELLEFFRSGSFSDSFVSWDSNLTGFEGFMTNMHNVLNGFFSTIGTVIRVVIGGSWKGLVQVVSLIFKFFILALKLTGIMY